MRKPLQLRLSSMVIGLCAAALMMSCGTNNGMQTAGIEGTGIATGVITGFGSIFVNGVEYKTTAAAITVNGAAASESQLRVGQVVTVRGSVDANGMTGVAQSVDFVATVVGPLTAVDAATGTLTVLGQTMRVDGNTSLDDGSGGALALSNLSLGSMLEVSGFRDSNGEIVATRIEVSNAVGDARLAGNVESVDLVGHRLHIKAVTVDFSAASLQGFPANRDPAAGDNVVIRGVASSDGSLLAAASVELTTDAESAAGEKAEVEGIVTRFASSSDFDVGHTHVTSDTNTRYTGGGSASLDLNVKVEVEGSFKSDGVLLASKIAIAASADFGVTGPVQNIDAANSTVTVFGVAVVADSATRFEDKSQAHVSPFNVGAIRVGDYLEVRGAASGAAGIAASSLRRKDVSTTIELRGPASAMNTTDLSVRGVIAHTDLATVFKNAAGDTVTDKDFFVALGNTNVILRGMANGDALQVTEASLARNE
jgi:hypothetical protein